MTWEKALQDGSVGIVVGILTAAILYCISRLWILWALPLIERTRYRGVDISGKWYGSGKGKTEDDPPGDWSHELTAELTQSAHVIGGTFHQRWRSPTNNYDLMYAVKGQLWEGYLILNLSPIDRRVTSYACMLLKVSAGGGLLSGKNLFRNVAAEGVEQTDLALARSVDTGGGGNGAR